MFEVIDPSDEAALWAGFVPPVPPTDVDDLLDVDELDGDDPQTLDDPPDPDLQAAGRDALTELEESLERGRLDGLDAAGTLAEAVVVRRVERHAQSRQLWLATHWADLHAVLTHPGPVGKGRERLVRLGGDGTPEVAEFAPAEFGVVQGMTDNAGKSLIGELGCPGPAMHSHPATTTKLILTAARAVQ